MSNEINGDPPNDEQAPDDHATEPDTDAAAAEEVKPPAADAEPVDTISAADHETAKKDVDWGDPEEDAAARAAADRRQRSQDKADAKEADAAEQDADKADRERQETEAQAEQGRQLIPRLRQQILIVEIQKTEEILTMIQNLLQMMREMTMRL